MRARDGCVRNRGKRRRMCSRPRTRPRSPMARARSMARNYTVVAEVMGRYKDGWSGSNIYTSAQLGQIKRSWSVHAERAKGSRAGGRVSATGSGRRSRIYFGAGGTRAGRVRQVDRATSGSARPPHLACCPPGFWVCERRLTLARKCAGCGTRQPSGWRPCLLPALGRRQPASGALLPWQGSTGPVQECAAD